MTKRANQEWGCLLNNHNPIFREDRPKVYKQTAGNWSFINSDELSKTGIACLAGLLRLTQTGPRYDKYQSQDSIERRAQRSLTKFGLEDIFVFDQFH